MTVTHYTGSVSFIRSHIGLLTPASQDRRVKGCWQVLIAKKKKKKPGGNKALHYVCVSLIYIWFSIYI